MNKLKDFLHRHPMKEKELGLDEDHVIINKDHWQQVQTFFTGVSQIINTETKEKLKPTKAPVQPRQKVICPECEGRGYKQALRCDRCWGEGKIPEHNLRTNELNNNY
ncbi:hypothetical protein DWB61_16590 [Ancylomarina euxinus]|uniref:Uncharacterized protein n=1 Tax=Ancylomarina euxinus TaxID=2283627 RepID=A0A425XWX8_9BACT|nr:hypothetical protein [Ancylomarina euxinus]MCZ4696282.1 hypothetical protein [Ancylomarina euxinus]MUP16688.1 hypothetical protein [Ancylomarina euxinus]RRG19138.1 hypothetical protein DWB61_16590 [Ancylomarina euxinus]